MADFLSKIVVSWQIFFQKFQTVLNQGAGWSAYTQKKINYLQMLWLKYSMLSSAVIALAIKEKKKFKLI